MNVDRLAEWATQALEFAGLAVILFGIAFATVGALLSAARRRDPEHAYHRLRLEVGRTILLGLEFLIASDIIRTIAVAPTLSNIVFLGVIVLIRTFLSFSLEVELEGRWPWHAREAGDMDTRV